jgi:hypothetical protein
MSGSSFISGVDYIDFDTTATVTQPTVGRLSWNDTDGTLDVGLKGSNVTLQIGQEELYHVINQTGSTILNGRVVMFDGNLWHYGKYPTKGERNVVNINLVIENVKNIIYF